MFHCIRKEEYKHLQSIIVEIPLKPEQNVAQTKAETIASDSLGSPNIQALWMQSDREKMHGVVLEVGTLDYQEQF